MPALLFTDIEGSTRLWEEHTDEMREALAEHDAILVRAIAVAGGSVLKTTGDGMVAVFESVSAALAAAIHAQSDLQSEPWEATGPIRVRMGIHTGNAESRNDDLFGPVMNRTARIMAAGHGEQVLLSAASAEHVSGDLPPGADLLDLGRHRLKDLTLPEHLYQLVYPGLRSDFPPPVTIDSRPHNLPLQATEFLGREAELAAVSLMLQSPKTRLLTLAGPGGAGKTRLGLQLAAEQLEDFADGVFFVDLSRETDPDAAFEAVVRALDLPVSGGGDALQILHRWLRDREILLVLDNFEQLISAANGLAELIQRAPGLKVVLTSRETLRIRAEQVYPVPPLGLPDPRDGLISIAEAESVQLFVDRARAVRPDFALTDQNAVAVAEICLRLDGLPLAIELAAARLNVFSPADLLSKLKERLDVLGGGGRDLPDRQRTLWGAIGWSYELLDDEECALFELMSAFSSARLEAIEAVAAAAIGSASIFEQLGSLVDKSLIRVEEVDSVQRFSMLLMIKEYAESRLAGNPERQETVKRAHAVHYSAYAGRLYDRLRSEEREAALEELTLEIGNLRATWRYWVERGDPEQLFGLVEGLWALHEAKGWYHAAIELANDTLGVLATAGSDADLSVEELTLRTSLARAMMSVRGYTPAVEQAYKQVLEMTDGIEAGKRRYPVLRTLASYYMSIAAFDEAVTIGERLLEIGRQEDDESILVEAHYVFGAGTAFSGNIEAGLEHLDRAIDLFDPHRHGFSRFRLGPSTGVVARVASGLILWQCGALGRGIGRLEEALDLARQIDHPYSVAYALHHNGFLSLMRGRLEDVIEFAEELRSVAVENDYVVWETLSSVLEGVAKAAGGQPIEGLEMTEAAIALYRGLTTPPVFWPLILGLRGSVHALAGRPDTALELIDEAIDLLPNPGGFPQAGIWRGDFLTMQSPPRLDEAEQAYIDGGAFSRSAGMRLVELEALTRLVTLRREGGVEPDGREDLAALYDGFVDGFNEVPMVAARKVLDS